MDKFWENYIKTRPADSKGAFDAFRKMNQEPRNMELASGYGSSTFDAHTKREAAFKAYKDYKKSRVGRHKTPILTFRQFLPIYAKENFADGGRIGFQGGLKVGSPQSMLLQYGIKKAILPALEAMGVTLSAARLAEIATENPTALNKIAAYISSIPGKLEESDAQTKTAFKKWVSNFIPEVHGGKGPIPAPPPETFPAEDTLDKGFKDEGLTISTEEKIKVPDSIPPQIKTEPEGFPIPEQKGWQDYVLYKKTFGPGKGGGIPSEKGGGKSGKAPQFTEEEINAPLPPEIDNLSEAQLRSWIKKNAVKEGATENINIYKAYQKYIKDFKRGYVKSVSKDFDDLFSPGSIYNLGKARGFTINVGNIRKDLPAQQKRKKEKNYRIL